MIKFLCDRKGADRRAVLYEDRSCLGLYIIYLDYIPRRCTHFILNKPDKIPLNYW